MANVSAIILAAGLSKRMGDENKLLLEYKERPIIDWVIEHVKNSIADDVFIVCSEHSIDYLRKWENEGIAIIENKLYQSGMTSSIQAGLKRSESDGYMICLGDQPLIKSDTYDQIITKFKETYELNKKVIEIPYYGSERGNPLIFSSLYKDQIMIHPEPDGCRSIVQRYSAEIDKVDLFDPAILIDIDTKLDYEKLNEIGNVGTDAS